jgi:long-chain acyl-CoA synthetase
MTADRPWLAFYGNVPASLDYPEITLYDAVAATAARVPDKTAWDFLDTTASYRELLASIDACANALAGLGLKAGERILISMPTAPQGVIAFYAGTSWAPSRH